MDSGLKRQMDELCGELGLSFSTAVNIFAKKTVRERAIPFELELREPNAATIAALEDVENGRNLHGPFDSVEALMEDLNA